MKVERGPGRRPRGADARSRPAVHGGRPRGGREARPLHGRSGRGIDPRAASTGASPGHPSARVSPGSGPRSSSATSEPSVRSTPTRTPGWPARACSTRCRCRSIEPTGCPASATTSRPPRASTRSGWRRRSASRSTALPRTSISSSSDSAPTDTPPRSSPAPERSTRPTPGWRRTASSDSTPGASPSPTRCSTGARTICFLVQGADKAEVLADVLDGPPPPQRAAGTAGRAGRRSPRLDLRRRGGRPREPGLRALRPNLTLSGRLRPRP